MSLKKEKKRQGVKGIFGITIRTILIFKKDFNGAFLEVGIDEKI